MHAADKNQGAKFVTIQTSYSPPPIPVRQFDWSAVHEGYEPGDPIGRGVTEQEAIDDLLESMKYVHAMLGSVAMGLIEVTQGEDGEWLFKLNDAGMGVGKQLNEEQS
jgi:hypothetical protein